MSKSNYHDRSKSDNCYFCRAYGTVEHHIVPQRFGGPDHPTNIVELCSMCHKKIERLYNKQFYAHFDIDDERGKREFHRPCMRRECNNRVTEVWKNTHSNFMLYACEEHILPVWDEQDKFKLVMEVEA